MTKLDEILEKLRRLTDPDELDVIKEDPEEFEKFADELKGLSPSVIVSAIRKLTEELCEEMNDPMYTASVRSEKLTCETLQKENWDYCENPNENVLKHRALKAVRLLLLAENEMEVLGVLQKLSIPELILTAYLYSLMKGISLRSSQ